MTKLLRLPALRRPRTRGECATSPRPCPWVSCNWHALWITREGHAALTGTYGPHWRGRGGIWDALEHAAEHLDPDATCVLDLTEDGPRTHHEVAQMSGLTRQRVCQIEDKVIRKVRSSSGPAAKLLREAMRD